MNYALLSTAIADDMSAIKTDLFKRKTIISIWFNHLTNISIFSQRFCKHILDTRFKEVL